MNKKNTFWIMIGIGVSIVVLLILLSSILSVGERLRRINEYIEYTFYCLSFILVYLLIINPVRIILFAPTFSLATVLDPNTTKKHRIYRRVTKNIVRKSLLSEEDKEMLKKGLYDENLLKENLNTYFNKTLKNEINKIILSNAKTVMVSTAISQNGRLDFISVIVVNLKMIKEIVLKCGFRPSYSKLGKLSVNVFTTAMIAEGLEGLDFSDLFPTSTTNFLSELPILKPIASSIIQGISNALLTIRIGVVTRKYLFTEYKNLSKSEIRVSSIKESIHMIPMVVKDVMTFLPNRIAKMFSSKRKVSPEEQEIIDSLKGEL